MIFWILTTPRSGSNYVTGEIWRRLGGEPRSMEYSNREAVASATESSPARESPVRSYLDFLVARQSTSLNGEFYERFLADERARHGGMLLKEFPGLP